MLKSLLHWLDGRGAYKPEKDPELLSYDKATRTAAQERLVQTLIENPEENKRLQKQLDQRAEREAIQKQRAAAFEEHFEAVCDWWIDLADFEPEEEREAADEKAGRQFAGLAARVPGQKFSEKTIATFSETVDEIHLQAPKLSYSEITEQLRDATVQLLAGR